MGAVLAQFCHLLVLRALAVSALPVVNGTLDVPLEPRCGTDFGNVSCGANLCCSASGDMSKGIQLGNSLTRVRLLRHWD